MYNFLILILLIFAAISNACEQTDTIASGDEAPNTICKGDLIFEENFDKFDPAVWKHDYTLAGSGNWEFQWYDNSRTNSYVRDGRLFIKPTLTSDHLGGEDRLTYNTITIPDHLCTQSENYGCERRGTPYYVLNPIRSARISTPESFSFRYGLVEIRARLPRGDWLWPKISLHPRDKKYGSWPKSGQITVVESRGNDDLNANGETIGKQKVQQILHFGVNHEVNPFQSGSKTSGNGFDDDFHLYQLKWTPDGINLYVDNQRTVVARGNFWELGEFESVEPGRKNIWRNGSKMAPFDQEFFVALELAVGGVSEYFPDTAKNGKGEKPWKNYSKHALTDFWNGRNQWMPTWDLEGERSALEIDYIKVWAV